MFSNFAKHNKVKHTRRMTVQMNMSNIKGMNESTKQASNIVADENEKYDVTKCEKGIYANCIMYPESYAYHETYGYCINEDVDESVLIQALQYIVDKNRMLRSVYTVDQDGIVKRKVKKNVVVELPVVKLNSNETIEEVIKVERRKSFDLERGPLFRFTMFVNGEGEKKLITCFHHLIYDWNSAQIFIMEVMENYKKLRRGQTLVLEQEDSRFDNYIEEEKRYLRSEKANEDRDYWMKHILNDDTLLTMVETGTIENNGNYKYVLLENELMTEIETADFGGYVSVFVKMFSAYILFLYKYTKQKNLRIGVPIGRRNREREDAIGCYINFIVISIQLKLDKTIQEFVQEIHDIVLEGMEHCQYPYHELSKNISKEAKKIIPQLCQSAFYFNEWDIAEDLELGGELIKEAHQIGEYDFAIAVYRRTDTATELFIKYNENLLDTDTINQMLTEYESILREMVHQKKVTLEDLFEEKTQCEMKEDKSFVELFKEQVKRSPDSVAVVFEEEKMTYKELYLEAGKLAKYLQSKGIKKGTYVGIMLKRSTKLLMTLIAIQMAGGVYVPLDPLYPRDRIQYMLKESNLKYLILERDNGKVEQIDVTKKIYLDDLEEQLQNISMTVDEVVCRVLGEDLAYLLFTSGSTGRPKGIMISHGALSNFLISMSEFPGCSQEDTLLAVTTICFDIAGLEMYLMLLVGGKIEILSEKLIRDGIQLLSKVRNTSFTIMQATPATWQMLLAAGWEEHFPIKILCGGEALSRELADKLLLLSDEVYNMYGPTETTIWSTVSKVEENTDITLGKPIRKTTVYVLDENMKEVKSGETGELYIGGAGVAKGYINRPDETKRRFIYYEKNKEYIYKTGDLVKKLDDGNIVYIGRIDFQVKINGFRIELGEIEEALLRNNAVEQAVVVVGKQSKKLCAYLIAKEGAKQLTNGELETHLRTMLPEYMIPKQYYYRNSYPLTLNKKVDRKMLSELDEKNVFDENKIIYEFNQTETDYQKEKLIHELFVQQVKKTPNNIAVIFENRKLTYKKLDEESNKLANYLLKEHKLELATPVAIFMERSELLIIAIMGVLKAGGTYVPIDPHTPEERIRTILLDTCISVVVTSKCFVELLNKLQWECVDFYCYICMDESEPFGIEHSAKEQLKYTEEVWDYAASQTDDEIESAGWINSYTGKAFCKEEMDEYCKNTVAKLKPYMDKEKKVLEVGCGSGMIAYEIAPFVKSYLGTDISSTIIERTRKFIEKKGIKNIFLETLSAEKINQLNETFDIIIFNSVIQYFPGHNYLKDVLQKAINLLSEDGIIFIADIRDQKLKEEYIKSLESYRKKHSLKEKLNDSFRHELFLPRDYFDDLKLDIPYIKKVLCSNKIATIKNELTEYRYDVILEIQKSDWDGKFIGKKKKEQHGCNRLFDSTEPHLFNVTSENPAYIIFTSGSTGKPKGVIIEHRNVVNFMKGIYDKIDFSEGKTILSVTTVSFDIFVLENFIPLCSGMTIVMANEEQQMQAKELNKVLLDYNVDMLQTTPSRIGMLLQENNSEEGIQILKEIMIGGEPFPKTLLEKLNKICTGKIYNMYGPTETTVWSTVQELTGKENIDIGKPIANTQIYILNGMQPVQIGEIGELCIAGDGVARGYFKDEKQTATKFMDNPFKSGGRMYRTGDMAKWLPNGDIEFIGRADYQVKIRGYRIELGEIETCLNRIEGIKEAVVLAKKDQQDNAYLCAYIVAGEKIDIKLIRGHLLKVLPDYMVPSKYVQVVEIPLTDSGKVNRKKLIEQDKEGIMGEEYIAPTNEIEQKLVAIWKDILGISYVGVKNNFFNLGGHSLKATYLTARIQKEFHIEMPLKVVFERNTIEQMAKYITNKMSSNSKIDEKDEGCEIDGAAVNRQVENYLCQMVAQMQHLDKKMINTNVNLGQYNFDSISFTRLCVEVNKRYGIQTNPTIFYTYQTIEEFSKYIVKTFDEQISDVEVLKEHKDIDKIKEMQEESTKEAVCIQDIQMAKKDNGIAVIGIGGLMPGSENLSIFWENLIGEKDLVTEIPDTRWNYAKYEKKNDGDSNKVTCKWGAFAPDVDKFDAEFFAISPREAESMDPQQRIMLQVVWDTIENAGYNPKMLSGQEVGVYIGATTMDYMEITTRKTAIRPHTLTGIENSIISGRISYLFNFTGPSEIIDTACSSSLVSVCNAVNALLNGECKYAIAGGVNFLLSPFNYIALEKSSMLSRDGRCKAFDASANGYSRGEGAGALLLKPLSEAVKDGDHIYGVIRGVAVNHGGKANSLTAPNPNAQREVIKKAYDKAGFDPSTVDYIETHGTGTALGDPIEINGLIMAFHDLYKKWGIRNKAAHCGLGAVKTNIGHLEAAAGIAGMLKMLLSIEHKKIPANIHFNQLNPYIHLEETPFYIRSKTKEWKNQIRDGKKVPLRGGVSSFGFGGTNAHVLVEEYIPEKDLVYQCSSKKNFIIPLSAQYVEGVSKAVHNLYGYLVRFSEKEKTANLLNRIAYTLQTGRQAMKYRIAFTVQTIEELEEFLLAYMKHIVEAEADIQLKEKQRWEISILEDSDIQYILERYIKNEEIDKVAKLWERGAKIDWYAMYTETVEKIPLPSYPFQKKHYYLKVDSNNAEYVEHKPHPMIDELLPEESLSEGLIFQKILTYHDRIVREHVVQENCFMPGTCYLELALEGVAQVETVQIVKMRNVVWYHPLIVSKEKSKNIRLHLKKQGDMYQYQVRTSDAESPLYGSGQIELVEQKLHSEVFDILAIQERCSESVEKETFYGDIIEQEEIYYGPYFQGIKKIYQNENEVLGIVEIPELVQEQQELYYAHPVILDCALQCISRLVRNLSSDEKTRVPFSVEEIFINGSLKEEHYYIYLSAKNVDIYSAYLLSESGQVLVHFKNLVCRAIEEKLYYFVPKLVMVDSNKNKTNIRSQGKTVIVYQDDAMNVMRQISTRLGTEVIKIHVSQQEYLRKLLIEDRIGTIYIISTLIQNFDILSEIDFDQAEENGIYVMFQLVKVLMGVSYPVDVCIITNNVHKVNNENQIPVHASLDSFSKSAMLENSNLTIRIYDLDFDRPVQIERALKKIVEHSGAKEICIIRNNLWYERKLYRYQIDQKTGTAAHFKNKGIYIIVGMGGLGKEIGKYLAAQYSATILFISRGQLNIEKISVMERIENLGGAAYYYQADITDRNSVKSAIEQLSKERYEVNGVIVGAMVLKDKSLITMTKQDMEDVLQVKARGTIELWKALKGMKLDFVLFLSSVNAMIGSAGQSNYCAACAVQDSLAYAMAEDLKIPVKIINWSYWGSVGAVSSSSYNEKLMEKGLYPVQVKEGMGVIEKVLADNASQVAFFKASDETLEKLGVDTRNTVVKYKETTRALSINRRTRQPDNEILRLRQGLQSVEMYGADRLLQYFQKKNILVQPSDCVDIYEVCQKLHVIEKYEKLVQAFFNILERSGYVQCFDKTYYATEKVRSLYINNSVIDNYPELVDYIKLLNVCVDRYDDILSGNVKYTDVMFPGGSKELVTGIYKGNAEIDYYNGFVADWIEAYITARIEQDCDSIIRILEIGAGTGGTSCSIFKAIDRYRNNIHYVYTDISASFTNYGEQNYGADYSFVEFKVLNVEKNPLNQGFESESFDIVLGTDVLHATTNMTTTMNYIKLLLKKNGIILVNEMTCFEIFSTLTFGLSDGWWVFHDDLRISDSPLLSLETWEGLLKENGYQNIEVMPELEQRDQTTRHVIKAQSDGCVIYPKTEKETEHSITSFDEQINGKSFKSKRLKEKVVVKNMQKAISATKVTISESEMMELIIDWVKDEFSSLLKIDKNKLDNDRNIETVGMDSLMIIEVHGKWSKIFPQISSTLLFEYTTVRKIAGYLFDHFETQLREILNSQNTEELESTEKIYEEVYEEDDNEDDFEEAQDETGNRKGEESSIKRKDIAIIGVAGRYPMSDDIYEFWDNLKNGRNCTDVIPKDRWNWEEYYDPDNQIQGKSYSKWGGFLRNIKLFDAEFFGFTDQEAKELDPQERILLETTWSALDNAGYPGRRLSKEGNTVGTFFGTMYEGYNMLATNAWEHGLQTNAQAAHWMLPNRIAHYFDFKGPSISFDTACASSLTAIHYACKSIQNGECNMAVAGGINLILSPRQHVRLGNLNNLSHSGKTMSFGQDADGFVESEGVGVVVLKLLDDAIRDNDYIYGVVKASNVNCNGGENAFTMPNLFTQSEVIKTSLKQAELKPEDIHYVEAHVAGTLLGDPVEVCALNKVFYVDASRKGKCPIGTVKANIGHCEAASGVAALTKVLLQLRYKKLIPSINCDSVNKLIPIDDSAFYINKELADWNVEKIQEDDGTGIKRPRRTCINSNGAGGSNTNMIVEEYNMEEKRNRGDETEQVIVLSARNRGSLQKYASALRNFLKVQEQECYKISLVDIAFTLQIGREEMPYRVAFTTKNKNELFEKLGYVAASVEGGFYEGNVENETTLSDFDIKNSTSSQIAQAWTKGTQINWRELHYSDNAGCIPLPSYQFTGKEYWIDIKKEQREGKKDNMSVVERYNGSEIYIKGHYSFGKSTLMGMTYVSLAIDLLRRLGYEKGITLKGFTFLEPVTLDSWENVTVRILCDKKKELQCISNWSGREARVASAKIDENVDSKSYMIQLPDFTEYQKISGEQLYEKKPGIYENALHGMETVYRKGDDIWGKLKLSEEMCNDIHSYCIHPVLLDSAVLCRMAQETLDEKDMYLPLMIKEIHIEGTLGESCYCHVKTRTKNIEIWEGEVLLIDEKNSRVIVELKGVVCKRVFEENEERENTDRAVIDSLDKSGKEGTDILTSKIIDYLKPKIESALARTLEQNELYKNLMTIGCDSRLIISLSSEIQNEMQIDFYPTAFFEHPSIVGLAEYIKESFSEAFIGYLKRRELDIETKQKEADLSDSKYDKAKIKTIEKEGRTRKLFVDMDADIAIVGISGIFPQASNLGEFWENMVQNKNSVTVIPEERWDWKQYYKNSPDEQGKTNVIWGGFLKEVDKFDSDFFGISPREAKHMDPQQRIMLELAWKAIEDAGYDPNILAGSRTGVFIGVADDDYRELNFDKNTTNISQLLTGTAHNILTGRISYFFDFHGPSEPLDNACASSLVSIIHAVDAIQNNRCDMALAGGVHIMLNPEIYVAFDNLGILSADGTCRAFDKEANGTVRGEGAGLVMLKRLQKAVADKDHIYAVIKGTGISHGGTSNSMTAPNPTQQEAAIVEAFERGNIDPATISFIETHGTGTILGDPIEIAALKSAFKKVFLMRNEQMPKKPYCRLGSVKTQIGHLESASGIAGLIKVILCMKNEMIPGLHHFNELNPYINLQGSSFYIEKEAQRWERLKDEEGLDIPYRAGISSFGFSGVNAHIILEEYRDLQNKEQKQEMQLFLFSAKNRERLQEYVKQFVFLIEQTPEQNLPPLSDMAFTLQEGRAVMEERMAVIASSFEELKAALDAYCCKMYGKSNLYCKENASMKTEDSQYSTEALQWLEGNKPHVSVKGNRVALPTYTFEKKQYWLKKSEETTNHEKKQVNSILLDCLEQSESELLFSKTLRMEDFYVRDHIVNGKRILPGVIYLEMARQAAEESVEAKRVFCIQNVVWSQAIEVDKITGNQVKVKLWNDKDQMLYEIRSDNKGIHGQGRLVFAGELPREVEYIDFSRIRERCFGKIKKEEMYKQFEKLKFYYGETFKPVETIFFNEREAVGYIRADKSLYCEFNKFQMHPVLLEGSLQVAGFIVDRLTYPNIPYIPFSIERLEIYGPLTKECLVYAEVGDEIRNNSVRNANVTICDMTGRILVKIYKYVTRSFIKTEKDIKVTKKDEQYKGHVGKYDSNVDTSVEDYITKHLRAIFVEIVGLEEEDLDDQEEFANYNVDSMLLTEFSNKINGKFQSTLTPAIFFELEPLTLAKVSQYMIEHYGEQIKEIINPHIISIKNNEEEIAEENLGCDKLGLTEKGIVKTYVEKEPIAVIGLAGRMPMSKDLEDFWQNLIKKRDMVEEIPKQRFDWREYYGDPIREEGKTNSRWGGFIKDIDKFDGEFFGITPKEVKYMDPQQRIMFEMVWELLEDAGYTKTDVYGSKTGVYMGVSNLEYMELVHKHKIDALAMTGNCHPMMVNKISHFYNFTGPSEPVDTLCSSSLVALHRAVQDIRCGMCETAIAGGINIILSPTLYLSYGNANMLSSKGKCKTFDQDADGFVRAEGAGAVYLKPLSKAIADNDHIYGIIKGSAINHNGHTKSLTAPSPKAQAEVIEMALKDAGVSFNTINYLELHGTGTPLGDPIEVNGLKMVSNNMLKMEKDVKPYRCYLGAVKTNIGHLESAAGIAGVVKILLAMKYKTIPANIHLEHQNPYIDLTDTAFYIPTENVVWEQLTDVSGRKQPRRAGLSSFGAGGVNAHIIFEEYEEAIVTNKNNGFYTTNSNKCIFGLSARDKESLKEYARKVIRYFQEEHGYSLYDIAYTSLIAREPMGTRLAVRAGSVEEIIDALTDYINENSNDILYVKQNKVTDDICQRWVNGENIDWKIFFQAEEYRKVPFPKYPFKRESYWIEEGCYDGENKMQQQEFDIFTENATGVEQNQNAIGEDFMCWQEWVETPLPNQILEIVHQNCVVFSKEEKLTGELESSFEIVRWEQRKQFRETFEQIKSENWMPNVVIFAFPLDEGYQPEENLYDMTELVKAANIVFTTQKIHFLYVYEERQSIQDIYHKAMSGFLKSVVDEYVYYSAELLCTEREHIALQCKEELKQNITISYQDIRYKGKRYQKRIYTTDLQTDAECVPFKERGVYLITGGTGRIGQILTEYLIETYQANVILTGTKERTEYLNQTSCGQIYRRGTVTYICADVTKDSDMWMLQRNIDEQFEGIDGIFHLAGIVQDAYIYRNTKEKMQKVIEPKVKGTLLLDKLAGNYRLDFFFLFSSISAIVESAGQSDYAYANSFLDAYAEQRNLAVKEGKYFGRTCSINWPLWVEGGMSAKDEMFQGILSRTGIKYLERELKLSNFIVLSGDKQRLKEKLEIEEISVPIKEADIVFDTASPVQPYIQDRLIQQIEQFIKQSVSEVSEIPESRIENNMDFTAYGIDSVMILRVGSMLMPICGNIPNTVFFEYRNIEQLAGYLSDNYGKEFNFYLNSKEEVIKNTKIECYEGQQKGIAIIGMSGRYSMMEDLDQFWYYLASKKQGATVTREDLWSISILREQAKEFDSDFFGISHEIAENIPAEERLILEELWKAMESAGYRQEKLGEKIGLFIGIQTDNRQDANDFVWQETISKDIIQVMGLENKVVQCICGNMSTTRLMQSACDSLNQGKIKLAIVVSVSLLDNNHLNDNELGEGVGILLLKEKNDALTERDIIYGVVEKILCDLEYKSMLQNENVTESYQENISQFFKNIDISKDDIDFIELQDSLVEHSDIVKVLSNVFSGGTNQKRQIPVGFIKKNTGELGCVTEMAQIMKALLQFQTNTLAPVLVSHNIRQKINSSDVFYLPSKLTNWSGGESKMRRVMILSSKETEIRDVIIIREWKDVEELYGN